MTATDQRRPTASDVAHLKAGGKVSATFYVDDRTDLARITTTAKGGVGRQLWLASFSLRNRSGNPGVRLVAVHSPQPPLPPPPPPRADGWYVLTDPSDGEILARQSTGGHWIGSVGGYIDGVFANWIVGPRLVELGPDDLVVTVPEDVQEMLLRYDWHGEDIDTYSRGGPIHAGILVARAVADARGIPHAGRDGQAGEAE